MAKSSSQSVNRINVVSMDPFIEIIEITLRYFAKREADTATTTSTGNMCLALLSACSGCCLAEFYTK